MLMTKFLFSYTTVESRNLCRVERNNNLEFVTINSQSEKFQEKNLPRKTDKSAINLCLNRIQKSASSMQFALFNDSHKVLTRLGARLRGQKCCTKKDVISDRTVHVNGFKCRHLTLPFFRRFSTNLGWFNCTRNVGVHRFRYTGRIRVWQRLLTDAYARRQLTLLYGHYRMHRATLFSAQYARTTAVWSIRNANRFPRWNWIHE